MQDYGARADFKLTPAVPAPAMCADELDCSYEKVTLCAFDSAGATSVEKQLPFLSCMDSQKLPLFYNDSAPRSCADKLKYEWKTIDACFSGSRGDALLAKAHQEVVKKLGNTSFSLPLVQVDGATACTGTKCNYDVVSSKISGSDAENEDKHPNETGGGDGSVSLSYFFSSK